MLAIVICLGIAVAQEAHVTHSEPPKRDAHTWNRIDIADLPARVPKSISRRLFERYCVIMGLSEAQRGYAETFFDKYAKDCNRLARSEGERIRAACQELEAMPPVNPRLIPAYDGMMAACARFDDQLAAADHALFAAIESFLAESQRAALERVRLHRSRDRSPAIENKIYESLVDLAEFVEQLELDEAEMIEVDSVLAKYEEEVTPLFVAKDASFRQSLGRINYCYARMFIDETGRLLDVTTPEDMAQRTSMFAELQQLSATLATKQADIARVNRKYLPQVLERLPDEHAKAIRARYAALAWSYVYPDDTDPENLYNTVLDSPELAQDVRAMIVEKWTQYRIKYEDLCEQARAINEQNEQQLAATRTSNGIPGRREKIFELMWKRIAINKNFVDSLQRLLPPEVAAAHEREFRKHELAFNRARPPYAPLDATMPAHIKRLLD